MRIKKFSEGRISAKKKSRAFTLVELLISITLMFIVTGTVGGLFFVYLSHYEQATEITAARQRGEMVLSILEGPVLHSGMGMPNSGDFPSAFSVGAGTVPFDGWGEPLSAVDNGSFGDRLRIVYPEPMEVIVESTDNSSSQVECNNGAGLGDFSSGNGSSLKNWAIFPSVENPYLISVKGTDSLTVVSSADVEEIAVFDNLCRLRAMTAYVNNPSGSQPSFCVNNQDGSGGHSRVDGIGAINFDVDQNTSTMTVSVLALGSNRHDEEITTGDVPLWDEANWGWNEDYRHYRLVVVNGRWRVRN